MGILIISHNEDQSTCNVIGWIRHYNKSYHRINCQPSVEIHSMEIADQCRMLLRVGDQEIDINEIEAFWHRNGHITIDFPATLISDDFPYKKDLFSHFRNEKRKTSEYLHHQFRKKKSLGNYFQADLNKLIALEQARALSIPVPPTLVTTSKKTLVSFLTKYGKAICKPISDALMLTDIDEGTVAYYTNVLTDENVNSLGDHFPLSLFQQRIIKKYELRIFYLDGEFYSMAIFSQSDEQTMVDFRKYNHRKPNRTVPYSLPPDIQDKLRQLMKQLDLNIGSIDMAVTPENEYVFFEVNPVGQFGMTSFPCNYYLEKKIAQYLAQTI
ncbi:grasp-with-spasm system ATP-grasp peptide maturase [Hufsiella ginkgonis]|uniref:Grasp-with-spasm system ATP-grasp peptide maturase n=1 Tax=Hufsiella ginkgonis TaxID=2695274 RepID=A0A7K1XSB5_9SPHI|nr:grasp-with-spasm system ATP-grasp peptide maturase [Hufsiella ginkgonis]MXV13901.1 grasp-with-spasm system ATP-grasp peptide maturase [Hufsiella ginkgonis]